MITVVDYGVSNLGSVTRALARVGALFEVTAAPEAVAKASKLVLPGVGHFGEAMRNLTARGLEAPLLDAVAAGASLLGICVGFQMLFDESEEAPEVKGLAILPGRVRRFPRGALPVPHVGWNDVKRNTSSLLLSAIDDGEYFYFLHSYYVETKEGILWASCEYGVSFCAIGGRGRVAGIQFHPEKSQKAGHRVLRNFWEAA